MFPSQTQFSFFLLQKLKFLFPSPFGEDAQRTGEVEKVSEGRMRSRGVRGEVYSTPTIANTLYELLFKE